MTNILVLGKGDAFQTFIQGFGLQTYADGEEEVPYYVKMDNSDLITDGWIPGSLYDLRRNHFALANYDKVFIFPDELTDGMEKIAFFHFMGTCKIIVITCISRLARMYKRLGAAQVIISQDQHELKWLVKG